MVYYLSFGSRGSKKNVSLPLLTLHVGCKTEKTLDVLSDKRQNGLRLSIFVSRVQPSTTLVSPSNLIVRTRVMSARGSSHVSFVHLRGCRGLGSKRDPSSLPDTFTRLKHSPMDSLTKDIPYQTSCLPWSYKIHGPRSYLFFSRPDTVTEVLWVLCRLFVFSLVL